MYFLYIIEYNVSRIMEVQMVSDRSIAVLIRFIFDNNTGVYPGDLESLKEILSFTKKKISEVNKVNHKRHKTMIRYLKSWILSVASGDRMIEIFHETVMKDDVYKNYVEFVDDIDSFHIVNGFNEVEEPMVEYTFTQSDFWKNFLKTMFEEGNIKNYDIIAEEHVDCVKFLFPFFQYAVDNMTYYKNFACNKFKENNVKYVESKK